METRKLNKYCNLHLTRKPFPGLQKWCRLCRRKYSGVDIDRMSIPITPTPVLEGKNAKRFDRLVKQGLKKPVKFVPTPGLEEVKNKIAKESVVDYKKAFETLMAAFDDKAGIDCSFCPARDDCGTALKESCVEAIEKVILKQCTKGGE